MKKNRLNSLKYLKYIFNSIQFRFQFYKLETEKPQSNQTDLVKNKNQTKKIKNKKTNRTETKPIRKSKKTQKTI
jgi:hypothetical protein